MTDQCVLSTRDFTLLEAMLEDPLMRDTALIPLLKRKMASATVMFREDLPQDVASLSSRVTFSVAGRQDTRVLTAGRMTTPVGMLLPVDTLRGLALLGLREGQSIIIENAEGFEEQVQLEKVNFQPEHAMRKSEGVRLVLSGKPVLSLVQGSNARRYWLSPDDPEDPGPSAA